MITKQQVIILVLLLLGILGLFLLDSGPSLQTEEQNKREFVYAVCMDAYENNYVTKERCAQVQEQTKTEFLCTANNLAARCWVEVK